MDCWRYRYFLAVLLCLQNTSKFVVESCIPFIWLALESNETSSGPPPISKSLQTVSVGLSRLFILFSFVIGLLFHTSFHLPCNRESTYRLDSKCALIVSSSIIMGVGLILPSLMTIFPAIIIPFYFIIMVCQCFLDLSLFNILKLWSPIKENTVMFGVTFSSRQIGRVLSFFLSGVLVKYVFADPTHILYVYAVAGAFIAILVAIFVSSAPEDNRFVAEKEVQYIIQERQASKNETTGTFKESASRLLKILRNWSIVVYFSASCSYIISICLMAFGSSKILNHRGFSLYWSGTITALQWLTCFVSTIISSSLMDIARHKDFSTATVKKSSCIIGTFIEGIGLVLLSFSRDQYSCVISVIVIGAGAGFLSNISSVVQDLAPQHVSLVYGFETLPTMSTSAIVAALCEAVSVKIQPWYSGVNLYLLCLFIVKVTVCCLFAVFGSCDRLQSDKCEEDDEESSPTETTPLK